MCMMRVCTRVHACPCLCTVPGHTPLPTQHTCAHMGAWGPSDGPGGRPSGDTAIPWGPCSDSDTRLGVTTSPVPAHPPSCPGAFCHPGPSPACGSLSSQRRTSSLVVPHGDVPTTPSDPPGPPGPRDALAGDDPQPSRGDVAEPPCLGQGHATFISRSMLRWSLAWSWRGDSRGVFLASHSPAAAGWLQEMAWWGPDPIMRVLGCCHQGEPLHLGEDPSSGKPLP